ncbi:hypothetical protein DFQ28_002292 [Apophysomyces sp. BC1034]|nr:hypothetical protein DFQ30_003559 [Apophysomyces sp. BC1015]KAG0178996.1 hypothetical protein DFQ29_002738 [Apophysomyces sp. BC1021]KAG0190255.1 hypothetical protein DFQ28_002292 [Apophysomyces sp. BC1034]
MDLVNVTPVTPPYEFQPRSKRPIAFYDHSTFDPIDPRVISDSEVTLAPELLHDSEEDDEESLSSPSRESFYTTKQQQLAFDPAAGETTKPRIERPHRRKSVPHRSPSAIHDAFQATALDKSVVFQLDLACPDCGGSAATCGMVCKVICGESLLSALRRRVALARSSQVVRRGMVIRRKQPAPTQIEIPRLTRKRRTEDIVDQTWLAQPEEDEEEEEEQQPQPKKVRRPTQHHSGRPARVKGPCQACQEASDGCMRKAFDWPFPANAIFKDKGKPFVYLCNKCGLRYNKSGGCVCRHCRWVFCKEEKRKAMQHIEQMRRSRPDGYLDPNEDIEGFVCSPKYWNCGQPWKVGWVLNNLGEDDDEEEEDDQSVRSPSPLH